MAVKANVNAKDWEEFRKLLKDMSRKGHDFRRPLIEIGKNFLKSREAIFTNKNKGEYRDLTPAYKAYKTRILGKAYPILEFSDALKRSITKMGGDNIFEVGKTNLAIGSKVSYAQFHQYGTVKMAQREFLFWGSETKKFASAKWRLHFLRNMVVIIYNHILQDVDISRSKKTARAERLAKKVFPR